MSFPPKQNDFCSSTLGLNGVDVNYTRKQIIQQFPEGVIGEWPFLRRDGNDVADTWPCSRKCPVLVTTNLPAREAWPYQTAANWYHTGYHHYKWQHIPFNPNKSTYTNFKLIA